MRESIGAGDELREAWGMLLPLVLAVATFAGPPSPGPALTAPPYVPVPCKVLVATAHLEGKPITRHNLATLFEAALTMHGGPQLTLEDIGRALVDVADARACLAMPSATGAPNIPPRRR